MIFAPVLNEAYQKGVHYDFSDGALFANQLRNRTLDLPTGPMRTRELGERVIPVHVRQMTAKSEFEIRSLGR
ncbi:hypothetical protein RvY_02398 [Ramazzottius varieornatus]|uniref:Uncharacterized protein n=1 Tax=Ramazzottius varieornatus TaxID=947166 RepID=A0A1D1UU44_RAMVA|nr:hypothetical protein RvY_02398 [Ramazzottius varieornatus]